MLRRVRILQLPAKQTRSELNENRGSEKPKDLEAAEPAQHPYEATISRIERHRTLDVRSDTAHQDDERECHDTFDQHDPDERRGRDSMRAPIDRRSGDLDPTLNDANPYDGSIPLRIACGKRVGDGRRGEIERILSGHHGIHDRAPERAEGEIGPEVIQKAPCELGQRDEGQGAP